MHLISKSVDKSMFIIRKCRMVKNSSGSLKRNKKRKQNYFEFSAKFLRKNEAAVLFQLDLAQELHPWISKRLNARSATHLIFYLV